VRVLMLAFKMNAQRMGYFSLVRRPRLPSSSSVGFHRRAGCVGPPAEGNPPTTSVRSVSGLGPEHVVCVRCARRATLRDDALDGDGASKPTRTDAAAVLRARAQEEWKRGMSALHADTVAKLKKSLPKLETEIQQPHVFREFYKYAFLFCCTGAHPSRRVMRGQVAKIGTSGGRSLTQRPPISFYRIVARTEGCTYAVNMWALSLVQGPFSVATKPPSNDSQLFSSQIYIHPSALRLHTLSLSPHHCILPMGAQRTGRRRWTWRQSWRCSPWCYPTART
jgi:hypothetical protein